LSPREVTIFPFISSPLYFKRVLSGSHGGDEFPYLDIHIYIRLMGKNIMIIDRHIAHDFAIIEINEAIYLLRSGEAGRIIIKCI